MPNRKSICEELSFYTELTQKVLKDVYRGVSLSTKDLDRDLETVTKRVWSRGIKFLTIELPSLGKAIVRGLETGVFQRPLGFKPRRNSSKLPAFMQGVFLRIFHDDGTLLPDPDTYAAQELLQVCFLLYKLELPYEADVERRVIDAFVSSEMDLQNLVLPEIDLVLDEARMLLDRLFSGFDPLNIRPKHGPGSVATGERANGKYCFSRKYESLHQVYPYYTYFIAGGPREILDRVRWYKSLESVPYGQTKVILVPKDSRGPRLISSEPLEFQWIQGGLGDAIVRHVESHPLTRGKVNFTDQSVNAKLALLSSQTKEYATMDLKEASDRVSVDLVRALFPEKVSRALMAARSDSAVLPDGSEIGLTKFAPMGSALCFPVLACTVWALSSAIARRATGRNDVFVYGDDLVVPSSAFEKVVTRLPVYGLLVNKDKSFCYGGFRESCGMDAFNGTPVTPLKIHTPVSFNPRNAKVLASYSALMNAMFKKGFWYTSGFIQSFLEGQFGSLPYGVESSPFPCLEISSADVAERLNLRSRSSRYRKRYQRYEFRVKSLKDVTRRSIVTGWRRLLKDYSESNPLSPERVVVPRATKIVSEYLPV